MTSLFRVLLTTLVVTLFISVTFASTAQADAFAMSVDSQPSKSPHKPRLSGVYVSQFALDSWSIMQFYTDGVVIGVSVGNIEDICRSWLLIKRWFRRPYSAPNYSQGAYQGDRQTIGFSLTSSTGTVDYKGRYKGEQLTVRFHSRINGFRAMRRYHRFETICKD